MIFDRVGGVAGGGWQMGGSEGPDQVGREQLGPDRGSKGQMGSRHLEQDGGGWGTGVGGTGNRDTGVGVGMGYQT